MSETFIELAVLYFARITPLFLMPSLLPIGRLPGLVKVVLSIGLALIMGLAIPYEGFVASPNVVSFLIAICQEIVIGIGLIFGIQVAFAALLFAGKGVDLQLGFGVASVLDPMTQNQEALMGSLLNSLFTVSFFILDMHHLLLKGIAETFHYFPVGQGMLVPEPSKLIAFFSSLFVMGILIVMPVILGLFLLDVVIAFSSRTMSQVNVYFVSLPLKIFLGIFILSISLISLSGVISTYFTQNIEQWFNSFIAI